MPVQFAMQANYVSFSANIQLRNLSSVIKLKYITLLQRREGEKDKPRVCHLRRRRRRAFCVAVTAAAQGRRRRRAFQRRRRAGSPSPPPPPPRRAPPRRPDQEKG